MLCTSICAAGDVALPESETPPADSSPLDAQRAQALARPTLDQKKQHYLDALAAHIQARQSTIGDLKRRNDLTHKQKKELAAAERDLELLQIQKGEAEVAFRNGQLPPALELQAELEELRTGARSADYLDGITDKQGRVTDREFLSTLNFDEAKMRDALKEMLRNKNYQILDALLLKPRGKHDTEKLFSNRGSDVTTAFMLIGLIRKMMIAQYVRLYHQTLDPDGKRREYEGKLAQNHAIDALARVAYTLMLQVVPLVVYGGVDPEKIRVLLIGVMHKLLEDVIVKKRTQFALLSTPGSTAIRDAIQATALEIENNSTGFFSPRGGQQVFDAAFGTTELKPEQYTECALLLLGDRKIDQQVIADYCYEVLPAYKIFLSGQHELYAQAYHDIALFKNVFIRKIAQLLFEGIADRGLIPATGTTPFEYEEIAAEIRVWIKAHDKTAAEILPTHVEKYIAELVADGDKLQSWNKIILALLVRVMKARYFDFFVTYESQGVTGSMQRLIKKPSFLVTRLPDHLQWRENFITQQRKAKKTGEDFLLERRERAYTAWIYGALLTDVAQREAYYRKQLPEGVVTVTLERAQKSRESELHSQMGGARVSSQMEGVVSSIADPIQRIQQRAAEMQVLKKKHGGLGAAVEKEGIAAVGTPVVDVLTSVTELLDKIPEVYAQTTETMRESIASYEKHAQQQKLHVEKIHELTGNLLKEVSRIASNMVGTVKDKIKGLAGNIFVQSGVGLAKITPQWLKKRMGFGGSSDPAATTAEEDPTGDLSRIESIIGDIRYQMSFLSLAPTEDPSLLSLPAPKASV